MYMYIHVHIYLNLSTHPSMTPPPLTQVLLALLPPFAALPHAPEASFFLSLAIILRASALPASYPLALRHVIPLPLCLRILSILGDIELWVGVS